MSQPSPAAPRVSVIMNCRNSARFLPATLESLLAQTLTDYEVIFWDNGSTDDSPDLVAALGDPRFRYFFHADPAPLGESRNRACREARGEWLAFLDCDDLWEPNKLAWQVEAGRRPEVGLVYGYTEPLVDPSAAGTALAAGARQVGALHTGCAVGALPSGPIFSRLVQNNFVPLCSLMVRRAVFERTGGFRPDLRQAEDYDVILKVAQVSEAAVVQTRCSQYRIHQSNVSHQAVVLSIQETIQVLKPYQSLPGEEGRIVAHALQRHRARLLLHLVRRREWAQVRQQVRGADIGAVLRVVAGNVWRRFA